MKKLFFVLLALSLAFPVVARADSSKVGWQCFGSKENPNKYCVSDNPDAFFEQMSKFYAHGIKIGASKEVIEKNVFENYFFTEKVTISGEYRKYILTPNTQKNEDPECLFITLVTYLDHAVAVTCVNTHEDYSKSQISDLISETRTKFENMYGMKHETQCEMDRKKCEDPNNYAFYIWSSADTNHFVNTVLLIYKIDNYVVVEYKYVLDGPGLAGNAATRDED